MQEVKAYLRENMIDKVIDHLAHFSDIHSIAVFDAQNFGHSHASEGLDKSKIVKLELDIPDELLSDVIDSIIENGRTKEGHFGDGKIVVTQLNHVVRIADGKQQ